MALSSSRSALSATCKALRRCGAPAAVSIEQHLAHPVRPLSTSATRATDALETAAERKERPRWSYTPERMKGPGFSINIVKDPSRTIWHNNDDPAKLDAMYTRLLGPKGDRVLPDEIKWLAITHKSFDQGRRGFNTRLAYFGGLLSRPPPTVLAFGLGAPNRAHAGRLTKASTGRLIVSFEATRHIMVTPASGQGSPRPDPFGREPFQHSALANVDKLHTRQPQSVVSKERLAKLAIDVGLAEVTRWKPRMVRDAANEATSVRRRPRLTWARFPLSSPKTSKAQV
jgi:large subunit ribosomal protein L15